MTVHRIDAIPGKFKKGRKARQQAMEPTAVAIKGRNAQGQVVWYTGRAGADFISTDKNQAFLGYNGEGAARQAASLNRGSAIHGIHFEADL